MGDYWFVIKYAMNVAGVLLGLMGLLIAMVSAALVSARIYTFLRGE